MDDPFAAVAGLTGVGAAAGHARDAIDAVLQHRAMRRDAGALAALSAVRGAQASAEFAGADPALVDDPLLQGALRAVAEVPALARRWNGSPRQVLARLHVLTAGDLELPSDELGRPTPEADHQRLGSFVRTIVAPTAAPAVVVAAIVHAELQTIRPFGSADSLVALAAERIVLVARGVDTKAVSIPEAGHLAARGVHAELLEAYATGSPDGVAAWIRHCADVYARGAEEALAMAEAR